MTTYCKAPLRISYMLSFRIEFLIPPNCLLKKILAEEHIISQPENPIADGPVLIWFKVDRFLNASSLTMSAQTTT